MAPKKANEALRLQIEETIVARAQADDAETKRRLIEKRLIAEAEVQDANIAEEIARLERLEAQRRAEAQRRLEAAQAARRLKIEAELLAVAQEENAADEARAEAERLRQEREDLVALAPVLSDERTAAPRSALTACWEEMRSLYMSWGHSTVKPGQLACGAKLVRSSVSPQAVRELAAQLMRGGGGGTEGEEGAGGVDLRLLDVFLRRGGFSELLLRKDRAMAAKLADAIAASGADELPMRLPPPPPPGPFAPKPRCEPPRIIGRSAAPAWRRAPTDQVARRPAPPPPPPPPPPPSHHPHHHPHHRQPHAPPRAVGAVGAVGAAAAGGPSAHRAGRLKGRVNASLFASPQSTCFRGLAVREARHDPKLSNWPHEGGPASSRAVNLKAPQLRHERAASQQDGDGQGAAWAEAELGATAPRLDRGASRPLTLRPASATVRADAAWAATLPRVPGVPRPSSAPPVHSGLSPLMRSEMTGLVYVL